MSEGRQGRAEELTVEYDDLVGGIHVETLAEREGRRVAVEGRVRRRVVDGNGRVGEA